MSFETPLGHLLNGLWLDVSLTDINPSVKIYPLKSNEVVWQA